MVFEFDSVDGGGGEKERKGGREGERERERERREGEAEAWSISRIRGGTQRHLAPCLPHRALCTVPLSREL